MALRLRALDEPEVLLDERRRDRPAGDGVGAVQADPEELDGLAVDRESLAADFHFPEPDGRFDRCAVKRDVQGVEAGAFGRPWLRILDMDPEGDRLLLPGRKRYGRRLGLDDPAVRIQ